MIDMDSLKEINDRSGHAAGDAALRALAASVRRGSRSDDFMARIGGDEFVVVTDIAGLPELESLASRIELDASDQDIAVSAGIAISPRDGRGLADVMETADNRMYTRKRARKAGFGIACSSTLGLSCRPRTRACIRERSGTSPEAVRASRGAWSALSNDSVPMAGPARASSASLQGRARPCLSLASESRVSVPPDRNGRRHTVRGSPTSAISPTLAPVAPLRSLRGGRHVKEIETQADSNASVAAPDRLRADERSAQTTGRSTSERARGHAGRMRRIGAGSPVPGLGIAP